MHDSAPHTPLELQAYLDLDLGRDSELAGQLFSRAEGEAAFSTISLTSDNGGAATAYMTPEMLAWFDGSIAGKRAAALNSVYEQFRRDSVDGVTTTLLEADLDRIRRDRAKAVADQIDRFRSHRAGRVAEELRDARRQYHDFRANAGRDAKPINYLRDTVLLSLLAVPELLMNFTSFVKIEYLNPFFAGAVSIVVAAGIGLASHVHAVFLRQNRKLFGRHTEERERSGNTWVFWFATTCLFLCLALVAWGRFALLAEALQEARYFGGSARSGYLIFAGSMLGNVIVYLIGAIVIYLWTDPIPGFAEIHRRLRKLEDRYEKLYRRLLERAVHQKLAEAEDRLKDRQMREQTYEGAPCYLTNRALFERFRAQDGNVIARLREYRTRLRSLLVDRHRASGSGELRVFSLKSGELDDVRRGDFNMVLTPSEYAGKEVQLRYAAYD